ncbi:unnamed protein product [Polarella glacialis]|uniref:RING-type domain-containing protein n=1 Tax=Polarella glacialis TaxID=89957 RepID=A0A813EK82_POLGL|nr:unnamed protein product [Polarella glacialis]
MWWLIQWPGGNIAPVSAAPTSVSLKNKVYFCIVSAAILVNMTIVIVFKSHIVTEVSEEYQVLGSALSLLSMVSIIIGLLVRILREDIMPKPKILTPVTHTCTWATVSCAKAFELEASGRLEEANFTEHIVQVSADGKVAGRPSFAEEGRLEDAVLGRLEEGQLEDALWGDLVEGCHSCPCCLGVFFRKSDEVALLRCGHIFCEGCIRDWAGRSGLKSSFCPMCRTSFGTSSSS